MSFDPIHVYVPHEEHKLMYDTDTFESIPNRRRRRCG